MWLFFLRRAGVINGARVAALITAVVMVPFWIVSLVSAELYDLDLNGVWVVCMIYTNASYFLYGFFGSGRAADMYF